MNFRKLLAIFLALSLLLVACTEDAAPPVVEEVTPTLVDDLGTEFVVEEPYVRIVSLAPSLTESLFALGAGTQVVGRDEFTFYPAEALEVPSFGSLWEGIPTEAILGMEPDLIIAPDIITPEQVAEMEALGMIVFWQNDPVDFEGLYANLTELAALTGREAELEVLLADLQARVAVVEEAVAALDTETPVVFYELDATDPNAPWTTGSGTFIDYVITMAGGVNAAADLEGAYAMFSSEALIAVDPDFILLADAEFGITVEMVAERAGWETITAVINGNIIPIESSIFSLPGPRLVDGLEFLFDVLH